MSMLGMPVTRRLDHIIMKGKKVGCGSVWWIG